MRLDKENCIAFDKAIGASGVLGVETLDYGDIIDFVKPGSSKDELYLVATVREAITSANMTATLNLKVIMDSAVGFATAPVVIKETGAIVATSLTAGTVLIKQRLPLGLKQFLKATITGAVEATIGGKIDIELVDGVDFAGM